MIAADNPALVVWDYLCMAPPLPAKADVVIALGSHDEGVARHAASLMQQGVAPILVVSGGRGKDTPPSWGASEADHYADIARRGGVRPESILIEPRATNTGDNIKFTRELLRQQGLDPTTAILATKPYMQRRAYATALKQWPGLFPTPSSETNDMLEYHGRGDVDITDSLNLMVGDLQRMRRYAELGFQAHKEVPNEVWAAYLRLVEAGYDRYVLA